MIKFGLLLSMTLVLLSASLSSAAATADAGPFAAGSVSMAPPPGDVVIEGELGVTPSGDVPPPTQTGSDRNEPVLHDFPRLSLATFWVADWLDKPEGLAFLYQFQEIYGPSAAEDVLMIQRKARAENHVAWAGSTVWIQTACLASAYEWKSMPPEWAMGYARNNVAAAINMAVYMNRQHGVDWFLRDIHGEKIRIWSDEHHAMNLTPDCPLGAWDGRITYQGRQYSLGDTRGLTVLQWLKGPFSQAVIRNSLFARAFDGLQAEDYPAGWIYYVNGQVPDPKRDGSGFATAEAFEAYCRGVWRSWFLDFLQPLQNRFIVRLNGHNTWWYFNGAENPWPEMELAANGCKLEGYFDWGGWPNHDRPTWNRVYHAVEELYHPLKSDRYRGSLDARQGWDVTTLQVNASHEWASDRIDRYKRCGLANTLMGDGLFDGTAYAEDNFFGEYLRGGQTQLAPRGIREMRIMLGRARGPSQPYTADPAHPLEYRQFVDPGSNRMYTVVCNVWSVPVAGIPAEDGVWFLGNWPSGKFERLTGSARLGDPESDPTPTTPAEVAADAGSVPFTLGAVPSVTRTGSVLGLSAPVSSALEVRVVGVDGRMVRTLAVAPGQQSVLWDGRDTAGRRVAPGLYFARAGGGEGGPTARVLIVR